MVEYENGTIVLRVVRDRTQWFIELRSAQDDECFDSRFVLAVLGEATASSPPTDEAGLNSFVDRLLELSPGWLRLFEAGVYETTKFRINELERISARERFGA